MIVVYATIWLVTLAVVGVASAMALAAVDPEPFQSESGADLLEQKRLSTLSLLQLALGRLSYAGKATKLLEEAELNWSVGRLVLLSLVAGSGVFLALAQFDWAPTWLALILALAAAATPTLYVQSRRDGRLARAEEQLPEALEFVSRALVAGHSLPMALELLGEEFEPPLSSEVRKAVDEYNLGLSMERALANLSNRLPTVDIQFFTSAIATQARTGGNLHELLDNLAETIREREVLRGRVRAMTANGRITAVVLSSMPFFIGGVMYFINDEYLSILIDHPYGKTLILLALCAQGLAFFVIRKLVDIKF